MRINKESLRQSLEIGIHPASMNMKKIYIKSGVKSLLLWCRLPVVRLNPAMQESPPRLSVCSIRFASDFQRGAAVVLVGAFVRVGRTELVERIERSLLILDVVSSASLSLSDVFLVVFVLR